MQTFRKKYLRDYGVAEVTALAFVTALIGYFNIFMKMDMTETLGILFQECESKIHDYENLCQYVINKSTQYKDYLQYFLIYSYYL
jgi:chloride channel 3/4/5